jgi:hypothetical protein
MLLRARVQSTNQRRRQVFEKPTLNCPVECLVQHGLFRLECRGGTTQLLDRFG